MATQPIKSWSRYPKVRLLGTGSFGHVYVCKEQDGSNVVLKRTVVDQAGSKLLEASATEVYVLSVLSHMNILRYLDHFVDDESHLNIVTEFCEGGDLGKLISKKKDENSSLDPQQVISIVFQVLNGVRYFHASQVIHRDLKPSNIFLTLDSIVKIGDFGISRMLSSHSMATTMAGTPFYISPEVCNNCSYTHPSDMWSVGCIIYELLTLNRPFTGPNILCIAKAVSACEYPALPPSRLADVVASLLVLDPTKRATAEDVLVKYFSYSNPVKTEIRQILHDALCEQGMR